jgi:hypothetical protein
VDPPTTEVPPTSATTEEPTAASIDIDSMFSELAQQSNHDEQQDQMDLDMGSFDDPNDVSSLLPGLETYANMTNAPSVTAATASVVTPSASDIKPEEKRKQSVDENELLAGGSLDLNDASFDDLFDFENMDFGVSENKEGNNDSEFLQF